MVVLTGSSGHGPVNASMKLACIVSGLLGRDGGGGGGGGGAGATMSQRSRVRVLQGGMAEGICFGPRFNLRW